MQISLGKNTECPAASVPITAPTSVGFWASRSLARSPGRTGLLRASLSFGAAVRLGLLPHTASRRQDRRLTIALSACSCLRLAVATNSHREGLSPPIQCPCQAHEQQEKDSNYLKDGVGIDGAPSCGTGNVQQAGVSLSGHRLRGA